MTDIPAPRVSILTLARGRREHLCNLIRGLSRQTSAPAELIVAVMQDEPYPDLPDIAFPVRQIVVTAEELPLAAARNRAAGAAGGEVLAFVDVDCIPAPDLVADYARLARPGAGLIMGEVMYLPAGAADPGWTFDGLAAVGVRHSDRQGPPPEGLRACNDYRCFWSLNFALHVEDWRASGGFDERFIGYGGEDTDFARGLDERGIGIWWAKGARVYHQYHAHHMPPVHAVASIVRNAELFAAKWGYRTMGHWLHAFHMMGLIAFHDDGIRILRAPGKAEFDLCRQEAHMPYAATARVVRLLEDRARRAAGLPPETASLAERCTRMTREQEALVAPPGRMPAE